METASFSGLINTLLFIIIFYYVMKFLARLFLPFLVKKIAEKAAQQFEKQHKNYQSQNTTHDQKSENQTNGGKKTTKTKEKKIVGEYIDFEEIK